MTPEERDHANCHRLLNRRGWPGDAATCTLYARLSAVLESLKVTTEEREAIWKRWRDHKCEGIKP